MNEAIGAAVFCWSCGQKNPAGLPRCPQCEAPVLAARQAAPPENLSPRSYGLAVALCGIFGTFGFHHFYLGNILHGLFDLGLLIATVALYFVGTVTENPVLIGLAVACFAIDSLHTIYIFIRLIIGKQRDGKGRLVTFATGQG